MNPAAQPWTARLRKHWRYGSGALAYRLLRRFLMSTRLGGWIDCSACLYIGIVPWRLRLPRRAPRDLRVGEATLADLPDLVAFRPALAVAFAQRLRAGQRCLAAWMETPGVAGAAASRRCVAQLWFALGPDRLAGATACTWLLPAGTVWVFDLYSDPDLLGVAGYLYAWLRQHPPGCGFYRLAGQVAFDNHRSRQLHRSLGYRDLATIWSFRLGPWRLYLSRRSHSPRRWRRHPGGLLPLHSFDLAEPASPTPTPVREPAPIAWRCRCGAGFELEPEPVRDRAGLECRCGHRLGVWRDGVAVLDDAVPYWGELPQSEMKEVLRRAAVSGWRNAVEALVPARLHDYIAGSHRADFHDLLPVPFGARILDVGAGWGGLALALARNYRVTALEGVAERARFIALRARQDRLPVTVVQSDALRHNFVPGQFDAIVVNGVLEWMPLFDLSVSPPAVQIQFLQQLRVLLAPGGVVYLGIENRFGLSELRGALDHSGLPYTSLLPRPLARWICFRSRAYRSNFNTGYRTYTYTHRGYRRLFAEAGLQLAASWISPGGYNHPVRLVPLHRAAIRFSSRAALARRRWMGWAFRASLWRWFGSDFVFLLRPQPGADSAGVW